MPFSDNLKGAFLTVIAMAGFVINDAMVKMVTPLMNVGQIIVLRGVMTTLLVFVIAWQLGALRPLKATMNKMFILRALADAIAAISFVTALTMVPLANAGAILQVQPLAVTLGAALFLAEPVGWRRWSAILIGFAGVLIIIRPGSEGFTSASLLLILCVIAASVRDLTTRRLNADIPSLFVTVISSLTVTVIGGFIVVPYGGFQPVTMDGLLPLVLGAVMLFIGSQAMVMAMRTGEISFIAPFRYTSLLWSIALGFVLFDDIPDGWMLSGATIVIAAGLYTFYRESRQNRLLAKIKAAAIVQ